MQWLGPPAAPPINPATSSSTPFPNAAHSEAVAMNLDALDSEHPQSLSLAPSVEALSVICPHLFPESRLHEAVVVTTGPSFYYC